jgi:hypothetical protein
MKKIAQNMKKQFHKLSAFHQIMMIIKNRFIYYFFKDRFGSFLQVGDIVEFQRINQHEPDQYIGGPTIYTIEKLQIVPNSHGERPTEVVIVIGLSYNDGKSTTECTLDRFKYIRHLYPNQEQIDKRIKQLR